MSEYEKFQQFVDACVTHAIRTRLPYDIEVARTAEAVFEEWKATHKVPKNQNG